jgi:hypothetical protein
LFTRALNLEAACGSVHYYLIMGVHVDEQDVHIVRLGTEHAIEYVTKKEQKQIGKLV